MYWKFLKIDSLIILIKLAGPPTTAIEWADLAELKKPYKLESSDRTRIHVTRLKYRETWKKTYNSYVSHARLISRLPENIQRITKSTIFKVSLACNIWFSIQSKSIENVIPSPSNTFHRIYVKEFAIQITKKHQKCRFFFLFDFSWNDGYNFRCSLYVKKRAMIRSKFGVAMVICTLWSSASFF